MMLLQMTVSLTMEKLNWCFQDPQRKSKVRILSKQPALHPRPMHIYSEVSLIDPQ